MLFRLSLTFQLPPSPTAHLSELCDKQGQAGSPLHPWLEVLASSELNVFAEVSGTGAQTLPLALLQERKEGLVPGIGSEFWK